MAKRRTQGATGAAATQRDTEKDSGSTTLIQKIFLGQGELKPSLAMLLLTLATLLCLVPCINKSYNLDDPLFVWAAQHIQKEPTNPYNFNVNWYQSYKPMAIVTKNPPGTSYFIAAVGSMLGYSEMALHFAFLFPAIGVVLGTYLMARWFCKNGTLAALLALCSPAFLVSASTVMSDVLMLCFWMFAIYFWLRGMESGSHLWLFLASLMIPLSVLSKYFGLSLIPLLIIYSAWKTRRPGLWLVHFIIPIATLIWYQNVTQGLYGHGLLTDAATYATEVPKTFTAWSFPKVLIGFAFSGGCVGTIIFFARRLFSWVEVGAAALVAFIIAVVVSSSQTIGPFGLPADLSAKTLIGIQFGFMVVAGIGLGVLCVLDFLRNKDEASVLLVLWVGAAFVFATFVNWTMNGRSILPMVPATAFLIVRRIEQSRGSEKKRSLNAILIPFCASALIAILALWGDVQQANTASLAAKKVHDKYSTRNLWFEGHWGFQYYFEGYGAHPLEATGTTLNNGDVIIVPNGNTNLYPLPKEWAHVIDQMDFPVNTLVSTMNQKGGAGFYADVFGPLPFTFNRIKADPYLIYQVN